MNIFNLFESKNMDNIKLGIQVVKTLGLEKEFEGYFGLTLNKYEEVFVNIIPLILNNWCFYISSSDDNISVVDEVFMYNFDVNKLDSQSVISILIHNPELVGYFDLKKLNMSYAMPLLDVHPQFISYLDFNNLDKKIYNILITYIKNAKEYFETNNIKWKK